MPMPKRAIEAGSGIVTAKVAESEIVPVEAGVWVKEIVNVAGPLTSASKVPAT